MRDKVQMCQQICQAMQHLAGHQIVHGDVALRNILVRSLDPVIVKVSATTGDGVRFWILFCDQVADFGLAKWYWQLKKRTDLSRSQQYQEPLPIRWLPPEVLQHLEWSEKSDVWAFGITMWEIFADGREPYADVCVSDADVVAYVIGAGFPQQPTRCPDDIFAVMKRCWRSTILRHSMYLSLLFRLCPEDRPNFEQLNHLLYTVKVQDQVECAFFCLRGTEKVTEISKRSTRYVTAQGIIEMIP